jgi:hypothetical protein
MTPEVFRTLYQAQDLPSFQNRIYSSASEVGACPEGAR